MAWRIKLKSSELLRQQIRGKLIDLAQTANRPLFPIGGELDDSQSLFLSGLLESLSLVQFVAFLERDFGLQTQCPGFSIQKIDSVNALLATLDESNCS